MRGVIPAPYSAAQWKNIVGDCTFGTYTCTIGGAYGSIIMVNHATRTVTGVIMIEDDVTNQSVVLTVPEEYTPKYTGVVGISNNTNNSMKVTIRAVAGRRDLYSSHSKADSVSEPSYMFTYVY